MRKLVLATIPALGFGLIAVGETVAAPIAAAPIAEAANSLAETDLQQAWYDSRGRSHPNRRVVRRGPRVYVAPPLVLSPRRLPVCRTAWVCNQAGRNCHWR